MTHEIKTDEYHVIVIGDVTKDEADEIARVAAYKPIYWSDDRCCHWMFDFKVGERWCTALFHNNGLSDEANEFDPLHIRVE